MQDLPYIAIISQKFSSHKDNWKNNSNRYTEIINCVAGLLTPEDRTKLNNAIQQFHDKNGVSIETAEYIIFMRHDNLYYASQQNFLEERRISESGHLDIIKKVAIDPVTIEADLRYIAEWCKLKFKDIVNKQQIDFNNDISDIRKGTYTKI